MKFKIEINGKKDGATTDLTMSTAEFEGSAEDMEAAFEFLFLTRPHLAECAKKAIGELEGME